MWPLNDTRTAGLHTDDLEKGYAMAHDNYGRFGQNYSITNQRLHVTHFMTNVTLSTTL